MALAFGRPIRELLLSVDSQEITDWQAYDRIEPFGDGRADLRMGILAALIANINKAPKSRRVWKPADFMPFLSKQQRAKMLSKSLRAALRDKIDG